jgi:uncharacterized lipoprotein YddW (UPF0748 family)
VHTYCNILYYLSITPDRLSNNPYWSKRYFTADWKNWKVDRAFIQAYNEKNFKEELAYAEDHAGIAITDRQLQHLPELIANPKIKGIFIFPFSGNPEVVAASLRSAATAQTANKEAVKKPELPKTK